MGYLEHCAEIELSVSAIKQVKLNHFGDLGFVFPCKLMCQLDTFPP